MDIRLIGLEPDIVHSVPGQLLKLLHMVESYMRYWLSLIPIQVHNAEGWF